MDFWRILQSASSRVWVWGMPKSVPQNSVEQIASSRVRVWAPYPRFPKEPGGYRARSSRAPRSGVGLVPVAVNDYSPQKCRCKPGASPVRAGDREVSPGPVMSRARRRRITTARDHRGHTSSGRSTGRRRRSARTRSCKMPRWQIICQRVVLLSASPAPLPSFRDPFQGADPITSDQYCRVPRIRAAATGRVSIGWALSEF